MAQFRLELASREDDADLRRILRENSMGGSISLTLRKEPSFFDDLSVEGNFNQVVAAREVESRRVVGFGVRSIKPAFVNGEKVDIGYLGCLRLDKQFRGTTLVPRGYKLFSELHKDSRVPFYLTTIVDDNQYAKQILTSNRMGMPNYNDFGAYHTYVIPVKRKKSSDSKKNIVQANEGNIEDIIRFVNQEGRKKQFYPAYSEKDLTDATGLLRGLNIEDILLHFDGADIDGIMASWNQSSFRQTVVEGYSGILKYARPIINLVGRVKGNLPYLPQEGQQINYNCVALIVTKDNDPKVFDELITSTRNRLNESQTPLLMLGLHSQDSLQPVAQKHSVMRFPTRLYIVTWQDGEDSFKQLDVRVPYLELGSL